MTFIGEYWRGEKPLWKAFWLGGLYTFIVIVALSSLDIIIPEKYFSVIVWQSSVILFLLSMIIAPVWWCVSVWHSSNISTKLWKILARLVAICLTTTILYGAFEVLYESGLSLIDAKLMAKEQNDLTTRSE